MSCAMSPIETLSVQYSSLAVKHHLNSRYFCKLSSGYTGTFHIVLLDSSLLISSCNCKTWPDTEIVYCALCWGRQKDNVVGYAEIIWNMLYCIHVLFMHSGIYFKASGWSKGAQIWYADISTLPSHINRKPIRNYCIRSLCIPERTVLLLPPYYHFSSQY